MTPIEELYREYLAVRRGETFEHRSDRWWSRHNLLKNLEERLEAHPDYKAFRPHDDYLRNVPKKVVLDYLRSLSLDPLGIRSNVTVGHLRKLMIKFVLGQGVTDLDLRAIVDGGWEHHALTDSGPRSWFREEVETLFDDWAGVHTGECDTPAIRKNVATYVSELFHGCYGVTPEKALAWQAPPRNPDVRQYSVRCPTCHAQNVVLSTQKPVFGNDNECVACLERTANVFLPDCGHLVLCISCLHQLSEQ
uniref:C3HC4 type zinc finger protein n=1 Tax=Marseillevirus LCMAC103 TaxID=2506604 RepID=A0A481YTS3_9VIRU|nr:MAG: C3HC4 type zinc finger protein [Marseillevirus LCMAC103]